MRTFKQTHGIPSHQLKARRSEMAPIAHELRKHTCFLPMIGSAHLSLFVESGCTFVISDYYISMSLKRHIVSYIAVVGLIDDSIYMFVCRAYTTSTRERGSTFKRKFRVWCRRKCQRFATPHYSFHPRSALCVVHRVMFSFALKGGSNIRCL